MIWQKTAKLRMVTTSLAKAGQGRRLQFSGERIYAGRHIFIAGFTL